MARAVLLILVGIALGTTVRAGIAGDGLFARLRHHRSHDLRQSVRYGLAARPRTIWIEHVVPSTGEEREYAYTATFRIEHVAALPSDLAARRETFFVAGVGDGGETIVERWVHERTAAATPGTPPAYGLARTPVFRGKALGELHALEVDPRGRFLLLAHGEPVRLSQLALPCSTTPVRLLDPSFEELLRDGVVTISRAQHEHEGLLWIVYLNVSFRAGTDWALVLRDRDHDGVLDDWSSHTYTEMSRRYPSRFSRPPWVDDFRSGQPPSPAPEVRPPSQATGR